MPTRLTQRITIKDLARELGMSVATVARAFHPEADIAAGTRASVLRLAAERGYQPDALARSMITGRTRIVGVVVADLHNPFYPQALALLSPALQGAGFNTMLVVAEPAGAVDAALRLLLSYRPEYAVVLATSLTTEATATCAAAGVPLLFVNRVPDAREARAVVCDNHGGAAAMAAHLIAGGMRRPGFIGGQENTSTHRERREGFSKHCAETGMAVREEPGGAFTYDAGREAARRLLNRADRPDALFCAGDILALGAIDAARCDLGLRVPEDLAVAGFDDIPMAAWPAHDLTTMRQPLAAMVEKTLAWVLNAPDAAVDAGCVLRLPAELVARGTTRPVPLSLFQETCP
jgi:DNA-binding LacI/PurR family transcriptional regulator